MMAAANTEPLRFAEYLEKAMTEDNWSGERPSIGDLEWADKVIAYIEWLREHSAERHYKL